MRHAMLVWYFAAALLAASPLPPPLSAQEAEAPLRRALTVARIEDSAIDLDGRLDDGPWAAAGVAEGFTQRDPVDGAPATERTEVRVLQSASAIYVGVRAFDSDPSAIVGRLARRDQIQDSDLITIYFDSFRDRRTAFQFTVTPRGSIGDLYSSNDQEWGDQGWDPVWQVATSVDASGWSAEFRIPFTQLRFATDQTTWGFQVKREIQRKSEEAYWAPVSKAASGFASLFGELNGLSELPSPARLEIRPYAVAEGRRRPASTGAAYAPTSSAGGNMGFDLKYGLTSDFTLDLAVNPDFGQVEADPAVVNLTAFESFFPARRPFFVEGQSLFNRFLPGGNLFYSRRIGRRPQGSAAAPTGGTSEIPDASTILSAAKITGKSAGGLGIGVLSALTTREDGTLRDASETIVGTQRVQPWVHHFAGRVEQDLAGGQHTIGAMVTALNRFDDPEDLGLRSSAYTLVADGSHRWGRNTYNFGWSFGGSRIAGSEAVILAAQRSSTRYFQRPDADYTELDPTRTSLTGYSIGVNGGKNAGTWRYYGWMERASPGFEVSDMGFNFGSVDFQATGGGLSYNRTSPIGPFRNFSVNTAEYRLSWTTGGERTATWIRPLWAVAVLNNNWRVDINPMALDFQEYSIDALRGGPALRQDVWHNSFVNINSDGRKPLAVYVGFTVGGRLESPAQWTYSNLGLTVRPNPTVNARVNVSYRWDRNPDQYVARRTMTGSDRYILAQVEQRTLDTNVRLDWTLTPNLSLQLYAQPFVSAGEYSSYQEVADPRAESRGVRFYPYGREIACGAPTCDVDRDLDSLVDASFDRPDFDVRSLRMTSVLRWEYRPGSVLFVAWQHGRATSYRDGSFDGLGAMPDLLTLPSDNTLLVKMSYWLGL